MFHSSGLQLQFSFNVSFRWFAIGFKVLVSADMQEQVSYDAGAVWDEVLDIASYGQRKLSSLSCLFSKLCLDFFCKDFACLQEQVWYDADAGWDEALRCGFTTEKKPTT